MTFRSRLLIAIAVGAIVPLGVALVGVRRAVDHRITMMFDHGLEAEASLISRAIADERIAIAAKLNTLARSLEADDRFRNGVARNDPDDRMYVIDYAEPAMRLTGLAMLQIQDDAGRILSSGHFPRENDQLDLISLRLLRSASRGGVISQARTAEGSFTALVQVDSLTIRGRHYYLTGGVAINEAFLARFARTDSVRVSLELRDSASAFLQGYSMLDLQFADASTNKITPARFVISQSRAELGTLLRDANRSFVVSMLLVVAGVIVMGAWLSHRLSRPLADLASAASRIDLDGEQVTVAAARDDEIGTLARRLTALTKRLGVSAERLRGAERRATVGDMARQVNHDIKNGLIPIRNVLRHLGDLSDKRSDDLSTAFAERRGTLDASVTYLDTLARQYARLTPRIERVSLDVNAIVREAAATAAIGNEHRVATSLAPALPPLVGDPVVLRRILDNLIRNGLESIEREEGEVTVSTAREGDTTMVLRVSDTGRGMNADEVTHAFDDFFTTKENGTGLGLSVVRRLTSDLGGEIRVESEPGRGTTFTLELPV